jgi:tetratricopeptide (TPR) repeat protein
VIEKRIPFLALFLFSLPLGRVMPAPPAGIAEAEAALAAADDPVALSKYREALLAIAAIPPGERPARVSPIWTGEVENALRRLHRLALGLASLPAARPVFDRWMDPAAAGDPNIAALARQLAGSAALRGGSGIEEAGRIWAPLGYLSSWRAVGPFENERGGGFGTEYGPEKETAEAMAAGRLPDVDPARSYPGKVRPVAWRKLSGEPLSGHVDLDALFRPNDEALAYAIAFVECQTDATAALRLGSDEAVKTWWNGSPILSRDVRRPLHRDQDAASIRLRKGWNWILLKVADGKGPWAFTARITALDGSPLEGWRAGDPPAGAPLAPPPAPGDGTAPPAPPAPSLGTRDVLAAAVAAGGEGIDRAEHLLGTILLDVAAHDEGEHPDRDLLRRAIASCREGAPAIYHLVLARASRRQGAISADRDDNEWREALEAAWGTGAPSIRAGLDLARHSLETFGNASRAEAILERVLAARPDCVEAQILRERIEERRGFPDGMAALEEALGKRIGPDGEPPEGFPPDAARSIAARRRYAGRLDEAEAILRKLLARDRLDGASRRQLVEILAARSRTDEALALLAEREVLEPFETVARLDHARLLEGLDRPGDALAAIDRALEIAPEDHEILRRRGILLRRMGRAAEAFEAWDRALAIQPNFPALREYIEYARPPPLVRNGGRLRQRYPARGEFSRRYRVDPEPAIKAEIARPAGGSDPVKVLLDRTAVRVNPDGTVKEFRQYVARAMNDRGIQVLGRYATPYAEGEQRVEFEAARVHRKDGAVEEARLSVHGGGGGEGGWRQASIDLPPVSVGDVVEVQHVTEDLRQSFFGDYFGRRMLFRGAYPVSELTFVLEAPARKKLHFHQRNLDLAPEVREDDAAGTITYTWTLRDVEAEKPEPAMPPPSETAPAVEVSTFASWDAFASWYWNLIRRQYEVSPAIATKVAELTSGKTTEEEKIRAIYDFVTGEIRYNAWEFGVHGFKPYNAEAIFARRFGDCKDKANLICTMLGAAGIRARPVIIEAAGARGEEDLTIPMVNHFNHAIAWVEPSGGRPGRFLDGTAEHHAVDEVPSMDQGAKVLVVREDGGTIERVPWNRPEELGIEQEIVVAVDADRGASIEDRVRVRGDFAAEVRSYFEVPGQRRTELERIYGARFAGATVKSEEFSDLADRSKPVEFRVTVRAPQFVSPSAEGDSFPALDDFFGIARDFAERGVLEERRHDLLLGAPRRSALSVVYLLPPGAKARSIPPAEREVSGRFGRLSVRWERTTVDGREAVKAVRILETTAPRVARDDYSEFRELAAALARLKDEKVVIEK